MHQDVWTDVIRQRLHRRRALSLVGGTAAAALIAACGGGSSKGGTEKAADKNSLVTKLVDTTSQAKRGGILKDRAFGDPPTLDPFNANNPQNAIGPMVFGSLMQFKPGHLKAAEGDVMGDLAESWEFSPDGLQMTLRLRPGTKWHNKTPVNGRAFDTEDVMFSWNRFVAKSSGRANVANAADPAAPVLSLSTPDSRTVVIKLKEPVVYALALFAFNRSGGAVMFPKETDSTFDPRQDMIGTNAFMLSNYTPSVSFTLKRHPEHYDKDHAMVDQVNFPIITEYAAALTQFKAGNIYTMGSRSPSLGVRQEEILSVKNEEPRLLIVPSDFVGSSTIMVFGFLPGSPFHDERVRQAVSMSWDRDLYIDTFNNVSKFRSQGLDVETRWNSSLAAGNEGWWLNPQGKDFGANGKYYRHDVAEAKKLLTAAGFASGLRNVTSSYVTGPQLPTSAHAEVIDGMIAEAGIASSPKSVDYATEYTQKYRDARGRHEGWAYITALSGGSGDPIEQLATEYWSKAGITFHGFDVARKGDSSGDPQVDSLIAKARVERDTEKRRALVFDIQRYLAKPLYSLRPPGLASGFEMVWPCLGNFRVNQRPTPYIYGHWIDETKPPFTK